MAGASFRMDLGPLERAVNGTLVAVSGDRRELASDLGEMLVSAVQDRFEHSRGPDGETWTSSKRVQEHGGQTLVDTARLRNSIGYEASPDMVAVGSSVIYAAIHQFGGKTGRGRSVTLPARPFLGISEKDIEEAKAIIADWLASTLGGMR